jgi:hypothetical protein
MALVTRSEERNMRILNYLNLAALTAQDPKGEPD